MTHCRPCGRPYQPDPFADAADRRCPICRAERRYWAPGQLGTRAHVYIRLRWWETNPDTGRRERKASPLDGLTGIGTRVDKPEDGWQVRLLESPERSLYFGAASVEVDWEIHAAPEPERSVWQVAGANWLESTSGETGTGQNPGDPDLLAASEGPRMGKVSSGGNGDAVGRPRSCLR